MDQATIQFLAIILGGLLTIASGIVTTTVLERQRQRREAHNLALAFKGEISALMEFVQERRYPQRIGEVIKMIEASRKPFYMPFRVHFRYDRVYDSNVSKIGVLKSPLPHQLPFFYTRLNSIIEDMVNLGEGTYEDLDLETLLRIYHDMLHILESTMAQGRQIVEEIDRIYQKE